MSEKFRNRYRIPSARASWWDYGNGTYFVTICTRNRVHFFGEILDGTMYKSVLGELAELHWKNIPAQFSYATLDAFVIMPNHVHGIISIKRFFLGKSRREIETFLKKTANVGVESELFTQLDMDAESDVDTPLDVETRLIASLHPMAPDGNDSAKESNSILPSKKIGGVTGIHNPMLHQNLARVIRWYTGRVSFEAHKIDPEFNWQRRYHDKIIRNKRQLFKKR